MTEFVGANPINLVEDLDLGHPEALIPALIKFLYDLREKLPMFVVYDRPSDFPEHVVARMWTTLPEAKPIHFVMRASNIERVRDVLEACGLVHLDRSPEDDPRILETWL
jgi:hypothetical protein